MTRDYCAIASKYADDVISGKIPACKWVRLACERQVRDMAAFEAGAFGFQWSERRANRVCAFLEKLPHIKGRWKSRSLILEPWQCFHLAVIFGWVDAAGLRRFRKALIVIPRKNGKTFEAAGIGLYMLAMDDEPGAEVYSAATARDQAKICWDVARRMVKRLPEFRDRYGVDPMANSIVIEDRGSLFKPLSRDADSLEGLNPHGAIIDELHAHKTREVFDVLDEATGARTQPLLFIISTEGDNNEGVFAEQVDYCRAVLEGVHEDESYFGIIYTIDEDDDWTEPASWRKANPNYGVSVSEKDLEVRARQAKRNAASQASFKTKRLNVRVGAASAYFDMLAWGECADPSLKIEDFYGCPCVFTLDLASKRDLTTRIAMFERGGDYYVFGRHYLPGDAIADGLPNYDFYRGWVARDKLIITEGNITDYAFVERDLKSDAALAVPVHVGVDPNYNAGQLTTRMLEEGVPMVNVPHNVAQFSEPMKSLDALILAHKLHHDGDPVLTWAMSNVVAKMDAKGNVYPRKSRDENKIDPAVALIGNLSLWLHLEIATTSMYDDATTAVM